LLKNVFNIFIGAASDGANVMVGEHNSFFSHLKQDVPHAILMRSFSSLGRQQGL
jgi:hypothetical protein